MKITNGILNYDEIRSNGRRFRLKSTLKLDLIDTAGRYSVTIDLGGTNEYAKIYPLHATVEGLDNEIQDMMVTLYDESQEPNNDSPQDKWFFRNMEEQTK